MITSISVGGSEHKTGLFADGIILSVSNPVSSMGNIQSIIDQFGDQFVLQGQQY